MFNISSAGSHLLTSLFSILVQIFFLFFLYILSDVLTSIIGRCMSGSGPDWSCLVKIGLATGNHVNSNHL